MKSFLAAMLIAGTFSVFGQDSMKRYERIAEPIAPRNIQVLLEKDVGEVLLEVRGPYTLFNPHDGARIGSGLLGKRFMVRELSNGLKWGEEFAGIHQIYIKPTSNETCLFVNGIQYSGAIAVYGIHGTIQVVNDVDIETYVKSVLTSRFAVPLETEVMSSLAILVRTDAYYRVIRNEASFWHVAASEVGFDGSALIVPQSPVDRASETTRHLILVHPDGGHTLPFAATWTEHCAGKTAAYSSIFRKEALAPEKGVEAPHAALARNESKWTYQISKKELGKQLEIASLKSLEIFLDSPSKKVYAVRVKDSHDSYDLDFFTFQEKVGAENIRSSDFTVSLGEDNATFTGYGKGHGAGLCLYSASALAQNGENAVKILAKFFPETYLYNIDAVPE